MPDIGKLLGVDGTKEFMRKIHDKFGEYVGNTVFNDYKTEVNNTLGTKANASDLENYATNAALNSGLAGKLDATAASNFLTLSYDKVKILNLFENFGYGGGSGDWSVTLTNTPFFENNASGYNTYTVITNIPVTISTVYHITWCMWGSSGNNGEEQDSFIYFSAPVYVAGTRVYPEYRSFALYHGLISSVSSVLEKTAHTAPLAFGAFSSNGNLAIQACDTTYQYGFLQNERTIPGAFRSLQNAFVIIDNFKPKITVSPPDIDYIRDHLWPDA